MLDENLPTFYIKPSSDSPLNSTIFLSQNASDLQPEYTLRRPDQSLPASKNCYAVALYDSYNPEVLFAEVLVQPEWTQPTLSAAEVRAQNGIPPPPVPIVPNHFAIQLYNPDQQVTVKQIPSTWNSSAYWEFEMPQSTFRLPSASSLDRSQSDPAASDTTPKIGFKWRRDGKLSKDISCTLSGKSTSEGRRNKEPDIVVAMFKGGKSLTLYEPNMHRVDVEDVKGLEVVFLLSATVIKDIYFNANREMFNIGSPNIMNTKRQNSGPVITGKASSSPPMASGGFAPGPPPRQNILSSQASSQQNSRPLQAQQSLPATNARSQWEIDAETARLKAQFEAEEKERDRTVKEEQKRIKKMLEQEEKEQKKRDAEVAKETERLRKQYGVTGQDAGPRVSFTPPMPPRPQNQQRPGAFPQHYSAPHSQTAPVPRPVSASGHSIGVTYDPNTNTWGVPGQPTPSGAPGPSQMNSPYLQASGNGTASSSGFFGLGGKKVQKKRSVFF